jgi:formylglycine-generating enzyme required for sulfatase activity
MRVFIAILSIGFFTGCKPKENAGDKGQGADGPDTKLSDVKPTISGAFSTESLVWVRGGSFRMGSNSGQRDEQPVHLVKVNSFWIGKFEVTNADFSKFTKATGYKTIAEVVPKAENFPDIPLEEFKKMDLKSGSIVFVPPSKDIPVELLKDHRMLIRWWKYVDGANWRFPKGPNQSGTKDKPNHPVVHIAWYDAMAYCEWKKEITGVVHRLPTEAEWEYAARGGLEEKEYIWGTEQEPLGKPMANIWHGRFPKENTKKDGYYGTAPVGTFPVNGYGIHDMAGNVWEWCSDWYRPEYYSESVVSNPKGPPVEKSYDPNERGAKKRIQRGGSFLCTDLYCGAFRPARRMKTTPDTGMSHAGFRIVVEAPPPATE